MTCIALLDHFLWVLTWFDCDNDQKNTSGLITNFEWSYLLVNN